MEFIAWDESMSVGVDTLDRDHQKLLNLFNELLSSGVANRSKDDLSKLLIELEDYTHFHFGREEEAMAEANYPDLEAHKKIHHHFIDEIARQRAEFEDSDAVMLRIDLILLLKEWLIDHIQGTDKKYTPFMRAA